MSTANVPDQKAELLSPEFEKIFRDHSRLIYCTAYGVTGSVEDAQDILQKIFLRLLEHGLPPNLQRNPRAYFYRAAVNQALDVVRSRRRRLFVGEEACLKLPASEPNSVDDELHQALYEAISQLAPESAQILILRYLHNYSDGDIAKLLGESRTTIAVRLFRLRSHLKQLIRISLGEES
jgi:RNA polymerase sigma-70 factor (ECF subfamily)